MCHGHSQPLFRDQSVTCLARVSRTTWRITVWKTCLEQHRSGTTPRNLGCLISKNWSKTILLCLFYDSYSPFGNWLWLVSWCLVQLGHYCQNRIWAQLLDFSAPNSTQKRSTTATWMITISLSFWWSVTKGCFLILLLKRISTRMSSLRLCLEFSSKGWPYPVTFWGQFVGAQWGSPALGLWKFWKTISRNEAWKIWTPRTWLNIW